jgi:hypothetical protein
VSRPGVTLIDRDTAAGTAAAVETDTAFIAGEAERGPVGVAVAVRSKARFEENFGGAFAPGYLWDAARLFPLEGGSTQYYSRAVGPSAKAASAKLKDGEDANTLEVIAAHKLAATDPGAWGNDLDVKTEVGEGKVTYTILLAGEQVEKSEPLATNADAVTWAEDSGYVRFKDLGGADPKAQEVSLSGGTDDRSNITDTERAKALEAFLPEHGPGQVVYPGATTTAMREALAEHAKATNRIVVPDAADTHTVATLKGSSGELSDLDPELLGCMFQPFGPWVTVEGEGRTTKTLPPSILVMAAIARHDRETYDDAIGVNNPNDPAAGINGVLREATGLSQAPWTDAERETLNEGGVNVLREVNGEVRIYGYRTMADPVTHPALRDGNNRRIDMAILAKAAAIGEEFVFAQIDARGQKLGELAGAIVGEVMAPYHAVGALFGDTPAEAYSVDVGDLVNPVEQLAEGKVRVLIRAKRSPAAEAIEIEYVKEEVA